MVRCGPPGWCAKRAATTTPCRSQYQQQAQACQPDHRSGGSARGCRAKNLLRGLLHHLAVHPRQAVGVGAQQNARPQQVDAPGHARTQVRDGLERSGIKGSGPWCPRHGPGGGRCTGCTRRCPARPGESAPPRAGPVNSSSGRSSVCAQLGLADQHDLQQLARMRFRLVSRRSCSSTSGPGSAPRR